MAKEFSVNILGLSKSVHRFEFELNEDFFKRYGQEVVANGKFTTQVSLDKRETFIEADFTINGSAFLVCDRSLEEFDFPVAIHKKVVFKYGEVPQEVSDEIIIITQDQDRLDLGQLMYEFIALQIPMKKLHPRFKNDENDGLVYTSSTKEDDDGKIDPRWEALKKLK
jgi:uncharacterized metal-binding protein YceD (DUF177 family)